MTLPGWLTDPDLLPVWQRLRAPLEQGAATTRLTGLERSTRHALGRLLGRPVTSDVRIVLAELELRLGRPVRDIVEQVTGRLRDRDAERAARDGPLAVLAEVDPAWAAGVRSSGLLTRLPDADRVVRLATLVLAELPGPGRLRTELAAAVTGDAHALDDGRPLAALVLRGLHGGALPDDRRAAWQSAGVLSDTVSTTVLTLGLAVDGTVPAGPRHLTPWDLRRSDVRAPGRVLVVENPSVLEAVAVRYGSEHALVCTAGWPAAVAVDVLRRLPAGSRYHGDLDWRGVEICGWLVERCRVVPWRMTAADYLAAPGGEPLSGREVSTPWDPELARAMAERGVAVHEEQLLAALVTDWVAGR